LRNLGPGAAMLQGARVTTEKQLSKLRGAIADFAKALGDANVLNDASRIAQLLGAHNFTAAAFLSTYTVKLKP
jgi:hypothetical protein